MKKKWLSFILSCCMILTPTVQAVGVNGNNVRPEQQEKVRLSNEVKASASKKASPSEGIKASSSNASEKPQKADPEEDSYFEDFDDEKPGKWNWGMEGPFEGLLEIKEEDGNQYLATLRDKEVKNTTTKKSFDVPFMTSASMSFRYRVDELKSGSRGGYGGFSVSCGDTEIISFYYNDLREAGDKTMLYYSGNSFDNKEETGMEIVQGQWYEVSLDFDFEEKRVAVTWEGEEIASIDFGKEIRKVDGFSLITYSPNGSKSRMNAGIDDFSLSWIENDSPIENEKDILSLKNLEDVSISRQEWEEGYEHPASVQATLVSGEKVVAEINKDTWISEPEFNLNNPGVYTWTAELSQSPDYVNSDNLKASYKMNYLGLSEHDYQNDFTLDSDIWEKSTLGSQIDTESGSGSLALSRKEEDGNSYLYAEANNSGHRGQRLALTEEILKGATVSFDWMPVLTSNKGFGEVMLFSQSNWNSYFTVRFDKDFNLSVYTKCSLPRSSTVQPEFDGAISVDDPIETGLGGQNKWFSVQIHLDYVNHKADFTITDKANPENTFTEMDIPIDNSANGLSVLLLRKNNAYVAMGLDNVAIDYERFGSNDIVAVQQPKDVNVAKSTYDKFEFPDEVQVEMGDGSRKTAAVGEWLANPAFDPNVEGEYIWTADLELDEGMTNYLDQKAVFKMTYTMLPYPLVAQNPNTLELEFGEKLPDLPKEVTVTLSDGTRDKMAVEEWVPIREFNPDEEGVYVWGANLKETPGKYQIDEDRIRPNEFHEARDKFPQEENPEKYIYHVYYRVNYFKSNNNYNGYTRSMENLDRGVYAIPADNGIFLSWRLLATEYGQDIQFNIYRNGQLINEEPITDKTNFVDEGGKPGDSYIVKTILDGDTYTSEPCIAMAENYLDIEVQQPEPQPNINGDMATYTLNDAGAADVDGDGQYEIIVKWYPSNGFDSGKQNGPSSPTIFDVYRMDGTPLWRLNMGLEMPSGAHFNQFMFYDLDEDGKAELFIKTSDGTMSYRPNEDGRFDMDDPDTLIEYIGDPDVVPGSNIVGGKNGHVGPGSNEYVTVFNGLTGQVIDSIDFVNKTVDFQQWGDSYGNRSARYNAAIAYLPESEGSSETIPAVLFNRGYYKRTTVAAYTLRDGKLNLEWNFVAETDTRYAGKGNHNMATGDVDNDGFDELVIGSLALDHNGEVLWAKDGQEGNDLCGHADAIHLAAMTPESDQLYVFTPEEDGYSTVNYSLSNAANGGRIAGVWTQCTDTGRGIAANITPDPGYEYWASVPNSEIPDEIPEGAIYNFYGDIISAVKPRNFSTNWCAYWDGDLLSELPDAKNPSSKDAPMAIHKYNWVDNTMDTLEVFEGTKTNNSTKNTPCLTADLLGDWREEIMVRSSDNQSLRIYMTDYETEYMIYTLMHDPVYRNAVANQNSSYNQPPHVGFYLGEDDRDRVLNMELPVADIEYTTEGQEPDTPDEPDTPEEPDTPDEPDTPEEPDTPDEPDTPNRPASSGNSTGSGVIRANLTAGQWRQDAKGWWFQFNNGTWPASAWLRLEWEGRYDWYYFNAEGYMETGWLTDGGNLYYLHTVSDGYKGSMYTGWHCIDGKWYYFNTVSDGTLGRLFVNSVTPDGYTVDENGAWVQ